MPTYQARTAGIYRNFIYTGCVEKKLIDQETGEEQERLLWRFQDPNDPTTQGEIAKFTGTSLQSANSNAHKMAAGIVGRKLQPGDDTEQYVGQRYDVVYGPNQAGNLTITSVVKAEAQPAAVAPTTAAPEPSHVEFTPADAALEPPALP